MKILILLTLIVVAFIVPAIGQATVCRSADPEQAVNKARFNTLSPEGRANVWRLQLTRRLGTPGLTQPQRTFLLEQIAILKKDLYTEQSPDKRPNWDAMVERGRELFGDDLFIEFVTTLDSDITPTFAKIKYNTKMLPTCTCWSVTVGYLCDYQCCQGASQDFPDGNGTPCACVYVTWGCGPFWTLPCDSRCGVKPGRV